jgi:hypothetical protein
MPWSEDQMLDNEQHFAEERAERERLAYQRELDMETERRKALGLSDPSEPTGARVIAEGIAAGAYTSQAASRRIHRRDKLAREVAIIRAENDANAEKDPRTTAEKLADRAAR